MNSKKKTIIIAVSAAVLVVIGVVIAVLCGNNKKQDNSYNFSAEIKTNMIEFYNGDELIQIDKYPDSKLYDFDFEYAKEHIEFKDINFDGKTDACLAISKNGEVIKFMCWLWENERFVYNKELSALTSISVDSDNKQIIAVDFTKDESEYVNYKWVEGVLTEVSRYKVNAPDVPAEVIEAVENNAVGIKTDDTTKTRSETAADVNENEPVTEKSAVTEAEKNKKATDKSDNTTKKADKKQDKKQDKKTKETTTDDNTGNVILATGDIDDGWF